LPGVVEFEFLAETDKTNKRKRIACAPKKAKENIFFKHFSIKYIKKNLRKHSISTSFYFPLQK